ncbi:DASH complex subunit ask1 [Podila clonocystis]|nr:DASH complex subunit ask1 [Podila clonocystis]
MSMTPQTASEVLDEIERLEQGITRTLQEIDQKFSTCQTIVTSKILPSIDLYGEASRDVWNHARLWLDFFKAASTSTAVSGVATRRAAASSSRASKLASAQPVDDQDDIEVVTSTKAQEHRQDDDNYNRRESVALFASGMLDVEGSPLGSMPSTPTPRNRDHNQRPDLSAPTRIQWPEPQPSTPSTTLIRPRYQHRTESIDQGSTTPRVTAQDKPMTFSPYTSSQALSSSIVPSTSGATKETSGATSTLSPRHQNLRANRKGSFLELDVDQDYQDVVTPPSTLQFSIPESRLATTPRSVIAKSRVDRILMKDGLVIPQPIFVREDEDARESGHRRNSSSEQNIGSSRKRNLDGDLLSSDQNHFQSKERLLASPRKMASVQDFLGTSDIGSANLSHSQPAESSQGINDEEDEEEDESDSDGRQSPSRRLMAQIQSQTEQEGDPQSQDPLMALVTPPDLRTSVLDYGTRTSIPNCPTPHPLRILGFNPEKRLSPDYYSA